MASLSIRTGYPAPTLSADMTLSQYGGETTPSASPSLSQRVQNAFTSVLDVLAPTNPVTGSRQVFTLIPESVELWLGKYVHKAEVNRVGEFYSNPEIVQIAEKACQRLAPVTDRTLPYQVKVLDTGVQNAACLPGGNIIYNRGLIEGMMHEKRDFGQGHITLEERVASCMAHEMAHGAARHGVRGLEFSLFVTGFLFVIAKVAQYALQAFADKEPNPSKKGMAEGAANLIDALYENLGDIVKTLWQASYSRENEDQADRAGMVYLDRAGYNPKAMIWLLKYLEAEVENEQIPWLHHVTDWFRKHDHSGNRAKKCETTLEDIAAQRIITSPTSAYLNPPANVAAAIPNVT